MLTFDKAILQDNQDEEHLVSHETLYYAVNNEGLTFTFLRGIINARVLDWRQEIFYASDTLCKYLKKLTIL